MNASQKCNGSLVNTSDTVQHGAVYSLEPRLRGEKEVGFWNVDGLVVRYICIL